METAEKLKLIVDALEDKKGTDIVTIDVQERTSLCEYFVICSGRSAPQVKALCDNVEEKLKKLGVPKLRVDGYSEGRWIALDYGDIIVHIFQDQQRLFYHLERLWQD